MTVTKNAERALAELVSAARGTKETVTAGAVAEKRDGKREETVTADAAAEKRDGKRDGKREETVTMTVAAGKAEDETTMTATAQEKQQEMR